MIVIGLSGAKRAGKDSVADILVRDHGFVKMSFAAPIKRLLKTLDPIVGFDAYQDCFCGDEECGPEVEEVRLSNLYSMGYDDEAIKDSPWGDEVRDLWQRFGTETIRAEDPHFWVDAAQNAMLDSGHERVVFTDVRFPNEAEMIYNLSVPVFSGAPDGGLYFSPFRTSVWQVSRPGLESEDDHESESHVGLMEEEIQIINASTLEELAEPVGIALKYVLDDALGSHELWPENLVEAGHE